MSDIASQRASSPTQPLATSICRPVSPQTLLSPDVMREQILPRVVAVLERDTRLKTVATELARSGDRIGLVDAAGMQDVLGATGLGQYDQRSDRVLLDKGRVDHIARQLLRQQGGDSVCNDRRLFDDLAEILAPNLAHEMRHRVDYFRIAEKIGAGQSGLYVREAEASGLKDEFIAASRLGERIKQLAAATTFEDHGALKLLRTVDARREPNEAALAEADRLYAFKPRIAVSGNAGSTTGDAGKVDALFRERYEALRGRLQSDRLAAYEWMKSPHQIAQIRSYFEERLR